MIASLAGTRGSVIQRLRDPAATRAPRFDLPTRGVVSAGVSPECADLAVIDPVGTAVPEPLTGSQKRVQSALGRP